PPHIYPLSLHDALPIYVAGRDLTDGRPQVCDPLARKPVDDSRPFPPRANQPGPREHVEMLGGVRDALRDLVRDLLDGTLTLRQRSEEHTSELQSLAYLV